MTDPRMITLKLASNWHAKVEHGRADNGDIATAWGLLTERVAPLVACPTCGCTPCPDATYCEPMRAADRKIRRCAQCGSHSEPLDPHRSRDRVIYLHKECRKFWEQRHR